MNAKPENITLSKQNKNKQFQNILIFWTTNRETWIFFKWLFALYDQWKWEVTCNDLERGKPQIQFSKSYRKQFLICITELDFICNVW